MIIGIQPDRKGLTRDDYSQKWAEFAVSHGAEVRWLDLLAPDALEQTRGLDGVMWRWTHTPGDKQSARVILYALEHHRGLPAYPNSASAWHFDDKIAQFYLLETLGAPRPLTWVFYEQQRATQWAATNAPYPLVFKLSAGAGSANVLKVNTPQQAQKLIRLMFQRGVFPYHFYRSQHPKLSGRVKHALRLALTRLSEAARQIIHPGEPVTYPIWWKPEKEYAYFQEFLPGNTFDTRITVIGGRCFGYRRLNRPGDFRASGSGRIEHDPAAIDQRCLHIAADLSRQAGFQSMAYDFLFKDGQPVISEISYAFVDTIVQQCPGHWLATGNGLEWQAGQMWPEEAQVIDFLHAISPAGLEK